MICIYVGDSSNVISRIRGNHCGGNVNGSAFRVSVAEDMGYSFVCVKTSKGNSCKLQIDSDNPKAEEKKITKYARSGVWRYVICQSDEEAKDFQWYVIDKLNPMLNKDCKTYDKTKAQRYSNLFSQLQQCCPFDYIQLKGQKSGPGVYVFYHDQDPKTYMDLYFSN